MGREKLNKVSLYVEFWRTDSNDEQGTLSIMSRQWPECFSYIAIGKDFHLTASNKADKKALEAFGNELQKLMSKCFSKVPPVVE